MNKANNELTKVSISEDQLRKLTGCDAHGGSLLVQFYAVGAGTHPAPSRSG